MINEPKRVSYEAEVLGKIWGILADGEREIDPNACPEFDTNNMYDLLREGVQARKTLTVLQTTLRALKL